MTSVVVLGATGFVGSAVVGAFGGTARVIPVAAPRLTTGARTLGQLAEETAGHPAVEELVAAFAGASVVVNAAGFPDASSLDENRLYGANALLPGVAVTAAERAAVKRFVHVSSAVVQNDKSVLDSSEELVGFSPYSASKVLGELVVREWPTSLECVRYRPPSVHASQRRVTRMIRKIAMSQLASVASPGTQSTPQALLPNVGAAIAALAVWPGPSPAVVHHPSEGVTVSSLMSDLSGGRSPRRIPRWLARSMVVGAKAAGRLHRPTAANARRIELLWLGQEQAESWLTQQGWTPPVGREGWQRLAKEENP